jgi:hypothetical protein
MTAPLFRSLDSAAMAKDIRAAQHSVCYAAPGIQDAPAKAMAEVAERIGPELITVCLDFDERVMRMGFGDLAAVKSLRDAGIVVNSTPGLRTGLVIVDHQGYIFTPTALYLEVEDRPADAPNAMRLSPDQVTESLARLSPAAKAIAIALAKTDEERQRIRERAVEVPSVQVADGAFAAVERRLEEAPPVRFDIARQVRVFNAYLQYVELKLTGAAIQRHRIAIPASIQKLGGSKDLEGRLRTTFDLIEKGGKLSSKSLEDVLNEIRKNFTPSLGKDHGRVVLKAAKPHLEERLSKFRDHHAVIEGLPADRAPHYPRRGGAPRQGARYVGGIEGLAGGALAGRDPAAGRSPPPCRHRGPRGRAHHRHRSSRGGPARRRPCGRSPGLIPGAARQRHRGLCGRAHHPEGCDTSPAIERLAPRPVGAPNRDYPRITACCWSGAGSGA